MKCFFANSDMGPHMGQGRQHPIHPQMFPEAMDDGIPLTPGSAAKMISDVGMGQTLEPSQMLKHAVVNLISYQVQFIHQLLQYGMLAKCLNFSNCLVELL